MMLRAAVCTLILLCATSCSFTNRKQAVNATPRNAYRLELPARSSTELPADAVLLVREVDVDPAFAAPGFVRRDGDGRYELDPYNRFFSNPGDEVRAALIERLRQESLARTIVTEYSTLRPTHFLETSVTELYGQSRVGEAVLGLRFVVHKADGTVLLDREHRQRIPVGSDKSKDLKAGWEQGLDSTLQAAVPELREALAKP